MLDDGGGGSMVMVGRCRLVDRRTRKIGFRVLVDASLGVANRLLLHGSDSIWKRVFWQMDVS